MPKTVPVTTKGGVQRKMAQAGHTPGKWDQSSSGYWRYTCLGCGCTAVLGDTHAYGSAMEQTCEESQRSRLATVPASKTSPTVLEKWATEYRVPFSGKVVKVKKLPDGGWTVEWRGVYLAADGTWGQRQVEYQTVRHAIGRLEAEGTQRP